MSKITYCILCGSFFNECSFCSKTTTTCNSFGKDSSEIQFYLLKEPYQSKFTIWEAHCKRKIHQREIVIIIFFIILFFANLFLKKNQTFDSCEICTKGYTLVYDSISKKSSYKVCSSQFLGCSSCSTTSSLFVKPTRKTFLEISYIY